MEDKDVHRHSAIRPERTGSDTLALVGLKEDAMDSFAGVPNIGTVLKTELEKIGVTDIAKLRRIGSVEAILRMNKKGMQEGCLNKLYALEGALQGIRWHILAKEDKEKLKAEYYAKLGS